MPFEREFKFVLARGAISDVFWHKPHNILEIEQGYLAKTDGMNARVRRVRTEDHEEWFTTLKQKVGQKTVEIETEISSIDGNLLMGVADRKVTKSRHEFHAGEHKWEVDVFYKGTEIYFLMAEVEVDEQEPKPGVPLFLKTHVIFEVPLTDSRFSNTKLGDMQYAISLYEKLLLNHQHENHLEF